MADTPSRLVVVRHGTTEWSREGRHTGRTDVPLEDAGRSEAEALRARLAGHSFARVSTSPLSRAAETCALAGFADQAEPSDDLLEWDYGSYEGLTSAQIRAERPGWLLWRDGVEHGETIDQVAARADRVIALARSVPGDTLAFAHGHILRVVCARWIELPPSAGSRFIIEPVGIGVLGWEREVAAISAWDVTADPLD